jgi:hypothetical protein
MIKRMFVLGAALFAALAVSSTSYAGGVAYTSTDTFSIPGGTVTDVTLTFLGVTQFDVSPAVTVSSSVAGYYTVGTNSITFEFGTMMTPNHVSGATLNVTFSDSTDSQNAVLLGAAAFTNYSGPMGDLSSVHTSYSLTPASVPEPASIALLGIGISGFIAFRRRFAKPKKHPVV